jgi:hypothetical protein
MGDWLSGRALPSHGRGHVFESRIAHLTIGGGVIHSNLLEALEGGDQST